MHLRKTAEEMSSKHHSSPWARSHTTSECYVNARRAQWRPQEAIAPFPSCIFSQYSWVLLICIMDVLYQNAILITIQNQRFFFNAQWILICVWKSEIWHYIIHYYSKMAGQSNRCVTSWDTSTSLGKETEINWQNQQCVFSPGVCQ